MVKAKQQPESSRSAKNEVATPEVAPFIPDQEKQKEPPKPTTGKGPKVSTSPSGLTIEDY